VGTCSGNEKLHVVGTSTPSPQNEGHTWRGSLTLTAAQKVWLWEGQQQETYMTNVTQATTCNKCQ